MWQIRLKNRCRGRAINIKYYKSVSILAIVIRNSKRMRRIVPSVVFQVLPQLYTLSHKERDFRKNVTEHGARGSVVVKALRYKPAGRGFDSRWCHWNFSLT